MLFTKQMRIEAGCVMPWNLFLRMLKVIKRKIICSKQGCGITSKLEKNKKSSIEDVLFEAFICRGGSQNDIVKVLGNFSKLQLFWENLLQIFCLK